MNDILCTHCNHWVKCTPHEKTKISEPYGFCLIEDLFTYTAREKCSAYEEGKCITENEWEESQRGCLD